MRKPGERFATPQSEAVRDFVERGEPRATIGAANHPPGFGMNSWTARGIRVEDREPTLPGIPRLPRGRESNRPTERSIPPTPNPSERLHRRRARNDAERVAPLPATPLRETPTDARFAEPLSPLPGAKRP